MVNTCVDLITSSDDYLELFAIAFAVASALLVRILYVVNKIKRRVKVDQMELPSDETPKPSPDNDQEY